VSNKLKFKTQTSGIRGDIRKARKPGRIQLSFMLSGVLKIHRSVMDKRVIGWWVILWIRVVCILKLSADRDVMK
jgi:hypothetical protein